jgi:hypothetical protein
MMRTCLIVAFAAALTGAASSAPAQTRAAVAPKRAKADQVPRGADGKPDLNGVWQGGTSRRGSWDEANSGVGVGGSGRDRTAPPELPSSSTPPGREPAPYQPWAAKKVLESFNKRGVDDPTAFCLPPGLPRANIVSLFPIQIVQTPKTIVFLYEYMNTFRTIPLASKHPDDPLPSYMGDSVGHWEGDTLVVDVTGFNDKTWLTGTGTLHSESLHVTERYTRVDKNQINYDVTMEDPKVLMRPWVLHSTMMLREGTRVQEYVCAENNLGPGRYEQLLKNGVNFNRP